MMLGYLRHLLKADQNNVGKDKQLNGSCYADAAFVDDLMNPTSTHNKNTILSSQLPLKKERVVKKSHWTSAISTFKLGKCCDTQRPLECLLKDKRSMKSFQNFLQSEYSDENLEFWIACEKFKKLTRRGKMASKAQKIYNNYIDNQSQKQVNLDSVTRSTIAALLACPRSDMFDQAQRRIEYLLENDSYRRFLEKGSVSPLRIVVINTK